MALYPLNGMASDDLWNIDGMNVDTAAIETKRIAEENETPAVSRTKTGGNKYIKDIEIHGTNVVEPEVILTQIKQKKGEIYDRDTVQEDLRNIYNVGYFSEKMRAIPVNNPGLPD